MSTQTHISPVAQVYRDPATGEVYTVQVDPDGNVQTEITNTVDVTVVGDDVTASTDVVRGAATTGTTEIRGATGAEVITLKKFHIVPQESGFVPVLVQIKADSTILYDRYFPSVASTWGFAPQITLPAGADLDLTLSTTSAVYYSFTAPKT